MSHFLKVRDYSGEYFLNLDKVNTIRVKDESQGDFAGSSLVSLGGEYHILDKESTDRVIELLKPMGMQP